MMWKYFSQQQHHQWIDVLDDLVHNYNNTKHSTILVRPADVDKDAESR